MSIRPRGHQQYHTWCSTRTINHCVPRHLSGGRGRATTRFEHAPTRPRTTAPSPSLTHALARVKGPLGRHEEGEPHTDALPLITPFPTLPRSRLGRCGWWSASVALLPLASATRRVCVCDALSLSLRAVARHDRSARGGQRISSRGMGDPSLSLRIRHVPDQPVEGVSNTVSHMVSTRTINHCVPLGPDRDLFLRARQISVKQIFIQRGKFSRDFARSGKPAPPGARQSLSPT